MARWHFLDSSGEVCGPTEQAELERRLIAGELPVSTLVWTAGMAQWRPAREVSLLHLPHSLLEDAATAEEIATPAEAAAPADSSPRVAAWAEGEQRRPWVRNWARSFDLLVVCLPVGVVLAVLFPQLLQVHELVLGVGMTVFGALSNAAVLALFGTTPGRWLLNFRLREADGQRLSFTRACGRELDVLLRGLGLGLPVVTVLAQFLAFRKLSRDGATAWDESQNFRVEHRAISPWRWLVMVGTLVGFLAVAWLGQQAGNG